VVWIDHREAKILPFDAADATVVTIRASGTGHHLQHKANITGSGHHGVDREYFERVIAALVPFGRLLVTGPGNTRSELRNFIVDHHPDVLPRIAAVEPLDHPSDVALEALGRKFFRVDDRMHAQISG
jgi:stalled ribosome rescue protein Dom34